MKGLSEDDLKVILAACKPTLVLFLSGGTPMGSSQQENANRAWAELGKRMRFDHMTVRPIAGKDQRFFTAVPSETETQRAERIAKETKENQQAEIVTLNTEISERQKRLAELEGQ